MMLPNAQPERQPSGSAFGRRRLTRERRGIAPLELVMSLPFLAGIFAMTMSIGWTTLYRSTVAVEARHEVWKLRDPTLGPSAKLSNVQERGTNPFALVSKQNLNPLAGMNYGEVRRSMRLAPGLSDTEPLSGAAVLANTWDHKGEGSKGLLDGSWPHFNLLVRLAPSMAAAGIGDAKNLQGTFNSLRGLGELLDMKKPKEILSEYNDAKGKAEEAQQESDNAKKEFEEKIDELQTEHDRLRDERDVLRGEQREYERQRDDLGLEIEQMKKQLAEQSPPDPALAERVKRAEERHKELDDKATDKRDKADEKEEQRQEVARELRQYRDADRRAEKEAGDNGIDY